MTKGRHKLEVNKEKTYYFDNYEVSFGSCNI